MPLTRPDQIVTQFNYSVSWSQMRNLSVQSQTNSTQIRRPDVQVDRFNFIARLDTSWSLFVDYDSREWSGMFSFLSVFSNWSWWDRTSKWLVSLGEVPWSEKNFVLGGVLQVNTLVRLLPKVVRKWSDENGPLQLGQHVGITPINKQWNTTTQNKFLCSDITWPLLLCLQFIDQCFYHHWSGVYR